MTGRHAVGEVLPLRVPPFLDPDNEFFWTSGKDGQLRVLRCQSCGYWIHPSAPRCRRCRSAEVGPEVVSGRGRVATWTMNVQPWLPDAEPYLIGLVELVEQTKLFLTTNLVDVDAEDVRIGLEVEVVFEHTGDIWYPLFRPTEVAG